jgi:stress-induced morphogen
VFGVFEQVNDALKEEMKVIHALSIKKTLTPLQHAQQQAK